MPVVAISVKRLNELLQKPYDMDELVQALEQLGCDVEDTAEQSLYHCPACQTPNEKLSREDPQSAVITVDMRAGKPLKCLIPIR